MRNTLRILCMALVFFLPACGTQSEVTEVATQSPSTTTTWVYIPPPISQTTTTTAPTTTVPPTTTTIKPRPRPTTTTAPVFHSASVGVWDEMAQCESGGNWAKNTGNGFYGGLQMDSAFWKTYGNGVAARADLASRVDQISAATKARDSGRGYSPWPHCRHVVGV